MSKLATFWASFPPAHKKRFYQAMGGYLLIVAATAAWIGVKAGDTKKTWLSRSPSATVDIRKPSATQIGSPAFNQAPVTASGKVTVAVIVTDLGLASAISDRAINELPKEFTLAFSPYAVDLQPWLQKAFHDHHESLIQMPMEPERFPQDDAGPRAISSRLSDGENEENLKWILAKAKGTTGVISQMGSRFLADKRRLQPVLEALQANKSIFIETMPSEKSMGRAVAERVGLPYMTVDLQIDQETTEKGIRDQLERLEKLATERGFAVATAKTYPLTLSMLKTWAPTLEKRGIILAPLSTVWKNKTHDQRTTTAPEPAPTELR